MIDLTTKRTTNIPKSETSTWNVSLETRQIPFVNLSIEKLEAPKERISLDLSLILGGTYPVLITGRLKDTDRFSKVFISLLAPFNLLRY